MTLEKYPIMNLLIGSLSEYVSFVSKGSGTLEDCICEASTGNIRLGGEKREDGYGKVLPFDRSLHLQEEEEEEKGTDEATTTDISFSALMTSVAKNVSLRATVYGGCLCGNSLGRIKQSLRSLRSQIPDSKQNRDDKEMGIG